MVTEELGYATPSFRKQSMIVCPCCGFKFAGSMADGCDSCGALPVGEALPRPEMELPSFGRSLVLTVIGSLMVLAFLTQTIIALVQKSPLTLSFWSVVAAAETAAWRMKWVAIPVTIFVLWAGRKLYNSVLEAPSQFCGLRYARTGFFASVLVPCLIALLIGVTVPERLRQRQDGIEAGIAVNGRTIDRALHQYLLEFGTYPTDLKDLARLKDEDGSIAAALRAIDITVFKATADVAVLPSKNPRPLRGAVIMKASLTPTDDAPTEGVSFTNYELPLAGADKVFGTEDDLIMRNGIIIKASEVARRSNSKTIARP